MSFSETRKFTLSKEDEDDLQRQQKQARYATASNNYYARLGISERATQQDIRRAFLLLSQRYHTDKHTQQSIAIQEAMSIRFKELQEAYSVLSDIKQRAAYDAAGIDGVGKLELVPKICTLPDDITRYIRVLDQEEALAQNAKMLAASSDMTVSYSIADLISQLASCLRATAPLTSRGGEHDSESAMMVKGDAVEADGAADLPTSSLSQEESTSTEDKKSGNCHVADATSGNRALSISTQVVAREVELDGRPQIVLMLSEDAQNYIRDIQSSSTTSCGLPSSASSSDATSTHSPRDHATGVQRRKLFLKGVMLAILPKSIAIEHSFQHAVTSKLDLVFSASAHTGDTMTTSGVTASAEYRQNALSTFIASITTSMQGFKIVISKQRVLSPLWTLCCRVTCLEGCQLLQMLELTLQRKLSLFTLLENTVAWSINQHGFFRTQLTHQANDGHQCLRAEIGFHRMLFAFDTVTAVNFGMETDDSMHLSTRGSICYSINCSPFSGKMAAGFEVWYFRAPLKHFGVGFYTGLACSRDNVFSLLLIGQTPEYTVINYVSFLYKRGTHGISIPITAFISPRLSQAIIWLSVPLSFYNIGRLLYRPYAKARAIKYYTQIRKEHIAEVDIARERAIIEQRALELIVAQNRALEECKFGLVIINARYGVLKPEFIEKTIRTSSKISCNTEKTSLLLAVMGGIQKMFAHVRCFFKASARSASPSLAAVVQNVENSFGDVIATHYDENDPIGEDVIPLSLDVTIALQNLVRDSSLVLPVGTKSQLVGFCDTDPYTPEKKQLRVVYWFNRKKHFVVVDDEDPIELPRREHLMF